VIGVEVPQAKVGFIYAPLLEDDPEQVKLLAAEKIWTQHQAEMHKAMSAALHAKSALAESCQ
jgi:hypothetical protein